LGGHDGRFTAADRGRIVRWLLRELAEASDGVARTAAERAWADGEWAEVVAACGRLRPAVERWLAGLEQDTSERGVGAD
jgi:hypothetical protein